MDRMDPSVHGLIRARIHSLFGKREPTPPVEQVWLRLDGRPFSVEVSSVPITYLGKESAVVFARDITERRTAAEALRRSEQSYRGILESAPDALVMMNRAGEIVLVNTQAERMFGHPREELLGRNSIALFPQRYRHRHTLRRESYFAEFQSQAPGTVIDFIGLRADGTEFPVEVRTSALETEGDRLILGAFRDVTERSAAERKSRQLEISVAEAEAANKAKSMFLSTMSHEIRTPMNAIMGYSQLMLRDPGLEDDARAHLKVINRSGEHLLSIINNVLDMAKIEAGQLQLTPRTFNLRGLLRDLEAMFRLPAAAKEIQLDVVVAGELVEYIVADEGKMRQVLINLLGNAVKFTEHGRIGLKVSLQERTGDGRAAGGFWLSAQVEDTGIGMTVEEQRRLFESFVQGQGGQKIHQGGTGLGLAISRKVANAMGGDITVGSRPGNGSTFHFEVPVERGAARDFHGQSGRKGRVLGIQAGGDAPRILIADDVPDNREWLIRLLNSLGFSVRSAENGEAAVLAWMAWKPQLILMDIHMPVMDGLEATRRIRSDPEGKNTVILALTADAMEEQRAGALASGVNAFISKPCGENELLESIRAQLGIDYIYDEETGGTPAASTTPGEEQIGELPADLIPPMRAAILNGDKALLNKLIAAVSGRGCAQSAKTLRELANVYQYERLLELLEKACPR